MTGKEFFLAFAGLPAVLMVLVYAVVWLITPRFGIEQEPVMYALYAGGIYYALAMIIVITTAR